MLSALIKAFTGRAGLGSLLALLIVALIAYTVVDRLPKVEQNVLALSQDYLDRNMVTGDTLMSLQVVGRDVHLGGEFEDPPGLKAGLESIDGVRSALLIGTSVVGSDSETPVSDAKPESQPEMVTTVADSSEQEAPAADETELAKRVKVAEVVTELLVSDEPDNGIALEQAEEPLPVVEVAGSETSSEALEPEATVEVAVDESSLSLRYDGTQLTLSGHVGDQQMADLLVEVVADTIPSYSVLTSNVDGNGKASPLNWMRQFLKIVAGLPEDAQGLISGSDSKGVQIIPDTEQTLAVKSSKPSADTDQIRENNPARVDNNVSVSVGSDSAVAAEQVMAQDQAAALDPVATPAGTTIEGVSQQEAVAHQTSQAGAEQTASNPPVIEVTEPENHPADFIVSLNKRLSETSFFQPGEVSISAELAQELDELVNMLRQHPSLYLRIVGNIDPSAGVEFEEFVGIDRARQVQRYLRKQQLDGARIFTAPLPRGYAFDKRTQLVFYISE